MRTDWFFNGIGGPNGVKRVFMVGVGGASMNGLAELLASMGYEVSGSDRSPSESTSRLMAHGIAVSIGHDAGNIERGGAPDLVVHTAAVKRGNPELERATALGVPTITRAELLGRVMAAYETSFAVAGSHGKSTTTAMLGEILATWGRDPTISVGADYAPIGGGMRVGCHEVFVTEACEYEDSFLALRPTVAAVTNIDFDHVDYFRDLSQLKGSFRKFARQASRHVVADGGDANSADVYWSLCEDERAKWLFYGAQGEPQDGRVGKGRYAAVAGGVEADSHTCPSFLLFLPRDGEGALPTSPGHGHFQPAGACLDRLQPAGACHDRLQFAGACHDSLQFAGACPDSLQFAGACPDSMHFEEPCRINLQVVGAYNIKNALAAAAAAHAAGAPKDAITEGLARFRGVKKRFEYLGSALGMDIVDDYAHHPSEIEPALAAARLRAHGADVWCVFQPHTYTRTKAFFKEFARAFHDATHVVLADIYAARERDPGDINSAMLAEAIRAEGVDALYIGGGFPAIAEHVAANGKPGDLVVTMGAGHASHVADILLGRPPRQA